MKPVQFAQVSYFVHFKRLYPFSICPCLYKLCRGYTDTCTCMRMSMLAQALSRLHRYLYACVHACTSSVEATQILVCVCPCLHKLCRGYTDTCMRMSMLAQALSRLHRYLYACVHACTSSVEATQILVCVCLCLHKLCRGYTDTCMRMPMLAQALSRLHRYLYAYVYACTSSVEATQILVCVCPCLHKLCRGYTDTCMRMPMLAQALSRLHRYLYAYAHACTSSVEATQILVCEFDRAFACCLCDKFQIL